MDWLDRRRRNSGNGQDAPHALSPGVATTQEDGSLEPWPPRRGPETPLVGADSQTQKLEPSNKEVDKSKKTKKKNSAHIPDAYRVAALETLSKGVTKALEQEVGDWKEAYEKLWLETEGWKQQLLDSKRQIDKLTAQEARHTSQLRSRIAALEDQRDELYKQLRTVESQKFKEAAAKGPYHDSGATPADLRNSTEAINLSSKIVSREIMWLAGKEWREKKLQDLRTQQHGINLARPGDVKFWIQHEIVGIAFRQLWDSRFFSLPLGSDFSESQQHWYARYRLVRDDSDYIPRMLDLSAAPLAVVDPTRCYRTACVDTNQPCRCGGAEFASFCHNNLNEIERLDIWRLVPTQDVIRIQESFIVFLTDVWLAHMLALALEQPACLFEVDRGQDFCKATMESAVLQEVDDEEGQIRAHPKVEFMIIPGFRVGKSVIRSHVYIGASS